ncbi:MAG: penicillin acylase family protein [Halioglobus sp.]
MRNILVVLLLLVVLVIIYLPRLDAPQREGVIDVPSLGAEVRVLRGDDGVPYVYAGSLDDALTAQGFLHAQDRLFQLELYKYLAHGRLAEFIGERGLSNDRIIRLVDISGFASDYAQRISDEERNYLQRYLNGVNDYINTRKDEFPLMLGLMGHEVKPWTLSDMIAIQQFRVWSSTVNWKQELLTLKLYDQLGAERAGQLYPITINPDDPRTELDFSADAAVAALADIGLSYDDSLFSDYDARYAMGSNAWATNSVKSAGGAPILQSDPHLDARHLPGFWYPMALITPQLRVVGGATPGGPGFGLGRNDSIAWGATNGYGDMADIYVEVVDPADEDSYLEGDRSIPFTVRIEKLKISDREAEGGYRVETMTIRETNRGAVISDHGMSIGDGNVLSLRWSVPEYAGPDSGNRELMLARSVDEALVAIGKISTPLNYIVADVDGNVARLGSGAIPLRSRGDGLVPLVVNGQDNWVQRIPPEEMPLQHNPAKNWVGSANHRVTDADYPHVYSTHFADAWRYRRLMELMGKQKISADDHWAATTDIKNMLAQAMVPDLIELFSQDAALSQLADVLQGWNFLDEKDAAAPLVFQSVLRNLVSETFADDMDAELLKDYLNNQYYWKERFFYLYGQDDSSWFDDNRTDKQETRDDLLLRAGRLALAEISSQFGADPANWHWGEVHTVTFFHPFIPGQKAANWIGGGTHRLQGSSETLRRGMYLFGEGYEARSIDSMRLVMDLSDDEKVEAHYPGGASERWFDPWNKNFLDAWLNDEKRYWWFSDQAITDNTDSELLLTP